MIDLSSFTPEIQRACEKLPVKRLSVFGSALTDKFGAVSDIDVLVTFDARQDTDLFSRYFELKERLQMIFGREVDLVIDKPFRNPVFQQSVEKTRTTIYER